jgi:hypothetical protein
MSNPMLTIYDPALCCSTGVCGPEVDESLVRFATDLEWLRRRGVEVLRYNLAQEPGEFARNALVRGTLQAEGVECLPLVVVVGGTIATRGSYPSRAELARIARLSGTGERLSAGTSPVRRLPIDACRSGTGCC